MSWQKDSGPCNCFFIFDITDIPVMSVRFLLFLLVFYFYLCSVLVQTLKGRSPLFCLFGVCVGAAEDQGSIHAKQRYDWAVCHAQPAFLFFTFLGGIKCCRHHQVTGAAGPALTITMSLLHGNKLLQLLDIPGKPLMLKRNRKGILKTMQGQCEKTGDKLGWQQQ